MRSSLLYPIIISLLCFAAACKKKDDKEADTRKALATYWELGGSGIDYNSNKQLDDSERVWKSIDEDVHLTLNEDGTGFYYARNVANAINLKSNWALGNGVNLAIYIPGYDSLYYTIATVTYDELILIDTDKPKELSWTFFYRGK